MFKCIEKNVAIKTISYQIGSFLLSFGISCLESHHLLTCARPYAPPGTITMLSSAFLSRHLTAFMRILDRIGVDTPMFLNLRTLQT